MSMTPGTWEKSPIKSTAGPMQITTIKAWEIRGFTEDGTPLADWISEEEDADFIVTAHTSCRQVNPDNPQAVAEVLPEMVEALKELTTAITEHDADIGKPSIRRVMRKALDLLEKAGVK